MSISESREFKWPRNMLVYLYGAKKGHRIHFCENAAETVERGLREMVGLTNAEILLAKFRDELSVDGIAEALGVSRSMASQATARTTEYLRGSGKQRILSLYANGKVLTEHCDESSPIETIFLYLPKSYDSRAFDDETLKALRSLGIKTVADIYSKEDIILEKISRNMVRNMNRRLANKGLPAVLPVRKNDFPKNFLMDVYGRDFLPRDMQISESAKNSIYRVLGDIYGMTDYSILQEYYANKKNSMVIAAEAGCSRQCVSEAMDVARRRFAKSPQYRDFFYRLATGESVYPLTPESRASDLLLLSIGETVRYTKKRHAVLEEVFESLGIVTVQDVLDNFVQIELNTRQKKSEFLCRILAACGFIATSDAVSQATYLPRDESSGEAVPLLELIAPIRKQGSSTTRLYNRLREKGIKDSDDIIAYGRNNIAKLDGIGHLSLAYLDLRMQQAGYRLAS